MTEMETDDDGEAILREKSLIDVIFSWSFKDVLNKDLYKDKVKNIPSTFQSIALYMESFIFPLIEETHADLSSLALIKWQVHLYAKYCLLRKWRVKSHLTNAYTLLRPTMSYIIALVQQVTNEKDYIKIKVFSSRPFLVEQGIRERHIKGSLFLVSLINTTTNTRIWNSLSFGLERQNSKVIQKILEPDFYVTEWKKCNLCCKGEVYREFADQRSLHLIGNAVLAKESLKNKECRNTEEIPGLRHAILIGDEWQLPAMVKSKVCGEARRRSLLRELALARTYLLNLHHSSSKHFLQGEIFGAYSFINVTCVNEEVVDGHSIQNMVGVVVVWVVANLFKHSESDFSLDVRSVGCGFKEGIVCGSVRKLASCRHCLWIFGNEAALSRGSVWKTLTPKMPGLGAASAVLRMTRTWYSYGSCFDRY
ncbi:hypothetical protein HAX54_007757 [Datura stramonium]|uniref:Uncharacterized protein n=1 Tax=Datura stramonium TaxID=4076 RepID=A0ABS8RIK6_DATST|nr:hypothetical protein [Datura stramonium]